MYGFNAKFNGSFDEAVTKVTEELSKEGFGVLTEIDEGSIEKETGYRKATLQDPGCV